MGRRLAASLAALFVGLAAAAVPAATRHPTVRLLRAEPFTVRGTHFAVRERVRVTVVANVRRVHIVRANAIGTFTTAFQDVTIPDRCTAGYVISARGNGGSVAALKVPPMECPPPLSP